MKIRLLKLTENLKNQPSSDDSPSQVILEFGTWNLKL